MDCFNRVRFGACPYRLSNPNYSSVNAAACLKTDCLAFAIKHEINERSGRTRERPFCQALKIYLD
jgi:hypothetical protein